MMSSTDCKQFIIFAIFYCGSKTCLPVVVECCCKLKKKKHKNTKTKQKPTQMFKKNNKKKKTYTRLYKYTSNRIDLFSFFLRFFHFFRKLPQVQGELFKFSLTVQKTWLYISINSDIDDEANDIIKKYCFGIHRNIFLMLKMLNDLLS